MSVQTIVFRGYGPNTTSNNRVRRGYSTTQSAGIDTHDGGTQVIRESDLKRKKIRKTLSLNPPTFVPVVEPKPAKVKIVPFDETDDEEVIALVTAYELELISKVFH